MADFKDLELLVAKIQKQLAPKARILHNVKLDGRNSGTKRQIDVLVADQIGQYEIRIVIDCKDYATPVDVKGVEEFYGLFCDVGAQKGVLVCPTGFTAAAKTRADGLQIDLYSPFDTDPHKWQVKATIPAICDFRSASMAFCMSMSAPMPFRMPMDFYASVSAFGEDGAELGTPLDFAAKRWDSGQFPEDVGIHEDVSIFPTRTVLMDNGYGMRAPVDMSVNLHIERQLYFGQLPVPQISGFKDECSGKVITNAFTVGMLDPDIVERDWQPINDESEATIKPVIKMTGRVCWREN